MSKIQKALGKLRESGGMGGEQAVTRPPVTGKDGRSKRTGDGNRRATGGGAASPYSRHSPDVAEVLPQQMIAVDDEILFREGLKIREADVDSVAEQFRRIKRPILNTAFASGLPQDENANVIMVASALPKAGKTFCSFNLATSIARERDVGAVLVDADVLKPNISRAFGLHDRVGLIDYLLDSSVSMDDILVMSDLHGIIVIPSGQQHVEATELLASKRMQEFVESLSRRFSARAVIVDAPPLLMTNEAHVLAEHMGQIALVIEAGVTPQDSIMQVLNSLNRSKPINAILNKSRDMTFGSYGVSGYGYQSMLAGGYSHESD